VCSVEGQAIFPRTDPCVIVAVLDAADRLLLAHARERPDRTYSLVAGFVEAGEALEAAVHREVGEEVGVEVTDLRYLTSQPWPFPASLMAGFAARAVDTPITVDGDEITDAHWFTRPALDAALMEGSVRLPPHFSVARRIVEAWRAGRL
jgi:NAD+ diphosphatase